MNRREFLKYLAALVATGALSPIKAHALEETGEMEFSPEVAKEFAASFVESFTGDGSIAMETPVPMLDLSGNKIGYEVDYAKNGMPYGYVILDASKPDLIGSFAIDENVSGPYSSCSSLITSTRGRAVAEDPLLYCINPLEFAIKPESESNLYLNEGSIEAAPSSLGRSKPTAKWQKIMIPDIYNGEYSLIESSYGIQVGNLTESTIENKLSKYACAVTALYSIAMALPYPSINSFERFLISYNEYSKYNVIWNMTGTTIDHVTNGITYGETSKYNIGQGFVDFCAGLGRNISYSASSTPVYSTYYNQTVNAAHSVFCAGLNTTTGRSGHAMAVEGVAKIKTIATSATREYLYLFDGWSSMVYLPLNDNAYLDRYGVYFTA